MTGASGYAVTAASPEGGLTWSPRMVAVTRMCAGVSPAMPSECMMRWPW